LLKESGPDEILPYLDMWKNMKLTELKSPEFYRLLNDESSIISTSNPEVDKTKAYTLIKSIFECLAESK